MALCHITATPGEPIAINSQSQASSATLHFDGLTAEFVTNTANVPHGTRSTTDDVVTTDVACDSETLNADRTLTGIVNRCRRSSPGS